MWHQLLVRAPRSVQRQKHTGVLDGAGEEDWVDPQRSHPRVEKGSIYLPQPRRESHAPVAVDPGYPRRLVRWRRQRGGWVQWHWRAASLPALLASAARRRPLAGLRFFFRVRVG